MDEQPEPQCACGLPRHHSGDCQDQPPDPVVPAEIEKHAEHLRRIVSDLRLSGDIHLVQLSEEGVGEIQLTLADELWTIAAALDPAHQFDHLDPDR